jgi:hypothetical protein
LLANLLSLAAERVADILSRLTDDSLMKRFEDQAVAAEKQVQPVRQQ